MGGLAGKERRGHGDSVVQCTRCTLRCNALFERGQLEDQDSVKLAPEGHHNSEPQSFIVMYYPIILKYCLGRSCIGAFARGVWGPRKDANVPPSVTSNVRWSIHRRGFW